MNGELTADNLETRITEAGEVVVEPQYLAFMRENGYPINGVKETHTVKREDSDTAHLVMKVLTLSKPTKDADAVADQLDLWVCDCWAWRGNSVDVSSGVSPSECGTCPHVEAVDKSIKAENDDQQTTLEKRDSDHYGPGTPCSQCGEGIETWRPKDAEYCIQHMPAPE